MRRFPWIGRLFRWYTYWNLEARYPVYAEADVIVDSHDAPTDRTTDDVAAALEAYLGARAADAAA